MSEGSGRADPVGRALLRAPADEELDWDDTQGLTEARQELARSGGVSTEELERKLELE